MKSLMKYKSPIRKLALFFEKSRDNWKSKYQESRKKIKALNNKLYYQQQKQREQQHEIDKLNKEKIALQQQLNSQKQVDQCEVDNIKKLKKCLKN